MISQLTGNIGGYPLVIVLILCVAGIFLGITGLLQNNKKNSISIIGIILNTSIIAFLVIMIKISIPFETNKNCAAEILIPANHDAYTQKDFNSKKYSWIIRNTVDPYMLKGQKNNVWGNDVEKFLVDVCKYATGHEKISSSDFLEKEGKALINAGCDDPLVLLWYGNICFDNRNIDESEKMVSIALESLQKSTYPDIHKFFASKTLGRIASWNGDKAQTDIDRWNKISMKALHDAIETGTFLPSESPIAFRLAVKRFDGKELIELHDLTRKIRGIDVWLKKMLHGSAEISRAWEARGGGWASEVTEEGWKGFRHHLDKAREILTEAWKLNPEYPEAACEMITVAMGGHANPGENEYTWFNRAVAAQMDYASAYTGLLFALRPRWGGSQNEMYHFGEKCLLTRRFDTDIPLFYLRTLREIGGEFNNYNWRGAFRRTGVHEKLDMLFDGLLNETSRAAQRDRILTQQALTEAWCGNYDKSKLMLGSVWKNVDLRDGFWKKALSWSSRKREIVEAELRIFTGPNSERLRKAEDMCLKGWIEKGLPVFEEEMKNSIEDEYVLAYLRRRIALTRMADASYSIYSTNPALYYAARENHVDVAKFLLEHGADVNEKNRYGETPLHVAVQKGHEEIVRLLLETEADVNIRSNLNELPLHEAISKKFPNIAKILIEAGSEINVISVDGWSPLHLALRYGQSETAALLIQKGSDINVVNHQLWSPLHMAIQYANQDVACLLIESGADVNRVTDEDWSPLHLAIFNKHPDIALQLIQHGADVNKLNGEGFSPLYMAVNFSFPEIVAQLIEKGAEVNVITKDKWSPIHLATHNNQPEIVRILAKNGADVNFANGDGWPALHVAAYWGYIEVVKVLIGNGADYNLKMSDGRTPQVIAKMQNHPEVEAIILSAMTNNAQQL